MKSRLVSVRKWINPANVCFVLATIALINLWFNPEPVIAIAALTFFVGSIIFTVHN